MNEPAPDISQRNFKIAGAAILTLALALRIAGARGDLTQDEIWTFYSLSHVSRIDQIFWKINFDNNHMLNTVWLYLVGPDASFLAMRAFSIAIGVVTVAVAGAWGARRSRIEGLIAMLLFATSYFMVNYQSEARGYAGLVLCIILAALALESTLEGHDRRIILTLAILCGFLFHYYMAIAAAGLAASCAWITWRRQAKLSTVLMVTLRNFIPAALLCVLAAAPIYLRKFLIGSVIPFRWDSFFNAYNEAIRTSLSLPVFDDPLSSIIPALLIVAVWFMLRPDRFRPAFYFFAMIAVPFGLAAAHVPNFTFPRYLISVATAFLLLCTEILAEGVRRPDSIRTAALGLLFCIPCANGLELKKFYDSTRGHYGEAVAAMAADGPTTFGVSMDRIGDVVKYYASRLDRKVTLVPPAAWCENPPQWFVFDNFAPGSLPQRIVIGPSECPVAYGARTIYPVWGLSGVQWLVYRRL